MKRPMGILSVVGAAATLLLATAPVGAYTTAAGAIATLSAQGIMAGGRGYPGGAAMSPVDLAAVLGRFETHTGHQGSVVVALRFARRVTRNQGLVDILRATGMSRTNNVARDRRIAERIGLFAGAPGMSAGNATLTRGEVAVMLVNLEHYWNVSPASSALPANSPSMVEGTVTAVNTQPATTPLPSSGSISVQTPSGSSTVPLSPSATIQQAGQSISLSQITTGEVVEIQLGANGQGQTVDVFPAGTTLPTTTTTTTTAATRGTVVSLSSAELTIQPQARGSAQVSYTLSPSVVVTAQGQGSSLGDVATGDLIQVHLSGGTVTWINVLATAGSTTGTITSALYGAFVVTEPTGQTVRVVLRPSTTVVVDGIDLPHGALARGEEVAVTGTSRGSSLAASSVTITGDSTPGAP